MAFMAYEDCSPEFKWTIAYPFIVYQLTLIFLCIHHNVYGSFLLIAWWLFLPIWMVVLLCYFYINSRLYFINKSRQEGELT